MTDRNRHEAFRVFHKAWIIMFCLVLTSYELLKWRFISADRFGEFLLRTLCFSPVVVRLVCSLFMLLGLLWLLIRKSSHRVVVIICEVILIVIVLGMIFASY